MNRREFIGAVACATALSGKAVAPATVGRKPLVGRVLASGKPMPGVVVSNGRDCVRTDANGKYELPHHANTRFVSVTVPSGWRCEWNFYDAAAVRTDRDFRLEPWKASAGKGCAFVQVADSEICSAVREYLWLGLVRRYADESSAAFIVHTGDICGRRGLAAHLQIMNDGTMGRPVVYCIGNHDMCAGERGEMVFESLFGPCWRSFEAGGVHFCVTPMPHGDYPPSYTPDDVADWLRNDLALVDPHMPVVLFNHTLCNEFNAERCGVVYGARRPIDLRKVCNFKGFVYGHYHNTYARRRDGALLTVASTPGAGGIDHSVETIKVFHVDAEGNIVSDNRHGDDASWQPSDAHAEWSVKLPGEILYGTPLVAENRLFVATADDENRNRQAVYALDTKSGKTIWRTPTVNSVKNRMLLVGDRIVAVDAEGFFFALAASDGREIWRHQLRFAPSVELSAPASAPDGRTVVAGVGERMMSVDVQTGKVNWSGGKFPVGEPSPIRPDIADGKILSVVNWRGTFLSDLQTGALIWKHNDNPPERYPGPDPVIRDGKAIAFGSTSVVEYDLKTGEQIRRVECGVSFVMPCGRPLFAEGRWIVGTSRAGIVALDAATYKVLWRGEVGPALVGLSAYRPSGSLDVNTEPVMLPNGLVAAAAVDGAIHVWRLSNGEHVREIRTGVPYLAGVAVQGDALFAADLHGNVRRFKV